MTEQTDRCIQKYLTLISSERDVIPNIKNLLDDLEKDGQLSDSRTEFHRLREQFIAFGKAKKISPEFKSLQKAFAAFENNARSIVMVADKNRIREIEGTDMVEIQSTQLFKRRVSLEYSICPETRYADQPSAFARGSGFFIKDGVVATAAHLIIGVGYDVRDFRFIHGLIKWNDDDFKEGFVVHKSQIWQPAQSKAKLPTNKYELFAKGPDWALIDVVPAYSNVYPSAITKARTNVQYTARKPKENDELYSLGHGLALPLKVSYEGKINRPIEPGSAYFECSLALLGGNSGSPIFYADDHTLAGIYMRGVKKLIEKPLTKEALKKTAMNGSPSPKCLIVKNDPKMFEGQECQIMDRVIDALSDEENYLATIK